MISEIFTAMLITSLSGSCLAAVILLARPLTKRVFGYSWHYYIWLTVLFTMLLPVRFSLPRTADIVPSVPAAAQSGQSVQTEQDTNIAASVPQEDTKTELLQTGTRFFAGIIDNRMDIIAYIWLAGAVTLLSVNLTGFIRLAWQIRKNSALIPCPELEGFTKRKVSVRVWERTSSPFMVGVIKPTLVLPTRNLTDKQLNNILRHEMTHLRRHDILYKWLVVLVKCLHWFNPMIWAAAKQIDAECEISCDMAVTRSMNRDEEMSYIDTILSLLPVRQSKRLSITTQMAGSKRMLERRFMMMKTKRTTSKLVSAVSAAVAAAMLSTTVFAGGVLSGLTGDDYTVEITNNGEVIELANKPFIENGEVYLPLRETFEKIGYNEANSYIAWNSGVIDIAVLNYPEENGSYRLNIGESDITFGSFSGEDLYNANVAYNIETTFSGDNVPLLKNDLTYIPYSYFEFLSYTINTDRIDIGYTIYDKDGNKIDYNGFYHLVLDEYMIKIPDSWSGKYSVTSSDDTVSFLQTATYDKYGEGSGVLFSIEKVNADEADGLLNMLAGSKLLYSDDEYAYIFAVPTDVQYPIWSDRDEEDIEIAAEYERMFADVDLIAESLTISDGQ